MSLVNFTNRKYMNLEYMYTYKCMQKMCTKEHRSTKTMYVHSGWWYK